MAEKGVISGYLILPDLLTRPEDRAVGNKGKKNKMLRTVVLPDLLIRPEDDGDERMPLSFSDRCHDGDEQAATITSCCEWCHSHFRQV